MYVHGYRNEIYRTDRLYSDYGAGRDPNTRDWVAGWNIGGEGAAVEGPKQSAYILVFTSESLGARH